jgi:hypothetical protein
VVKARVIQGILARPGKGVFLIEDICRDNKNISLFKISFPGLIFA